ncbi:MATE family efflux transporter [Streptomyces sp. NPDC002920]
MGFSTLLWLVAVAVQIVLDPLLIFGLDLGVRGAALGTVGGQAVSTAMSLWFFLARRDRPYRVGAAALVPHAATLRALLGLGLPSFLAGLGATLLAILVNTTLAATGAVTALAAYAVCARLQTFATMPHVGIGQGLQPIVGYNSGRGLADRVARARTLALRASLLYGLAAGALLALPAGPLVGLFLNDPDTAAGAEHALRILALGQIVAGVAPLTAAYFQALGRPTPAYVLTIGTLIVVKAPLVVVLGRTGTDGVWIGLAAGELVTAAVALLLLRRLRTATVTHSRFRGDR